ncbi:porin [Larsenimonas suaedae]|uniref:Porin n=1 Tax=Larsenimonas suaedae TaxID=1851019 RepID=A0ABU1GX35_9GAMM|nr:porin [Larsenimonas suaedae]MCM2973131.1 porin [Larsenimonas suaedae]MDR5896568.1 porin [Larsenimonas suaedae]
MVSSKTVRIAGLGLATFFIAQQAQAFIAYETPKDRLTISGRIAGGSTFVNNVDDDHNFTNAGSRVRLIHEHNFEGGWSSIARAEWGFDPFFEHGDDDHYKRLLYAGLSNDEYGTVLIGKQYSVWYDLVAVSTDWFWYNGATAQGSFAGRSGDGGFEGTGRADNAISYRNTFGDWSVGVLYQSDEDHAHGERTPVYGQIGGQRVVTGFNSATNGLERDYTGQVAVNYQATDDWSVGATYSHSAIDQYRNSGKQAQNVNAWLLGTRWTPGNWYFALTGGTYRNLIRSSTFSGVDEADGIIDEAHGYEGAAFYNLKGYTPGTVQLYSGFNRLEDAGSDARSAFYLLGAAWLTFNDNLILAVEHTFDDSKDAEGGDDAGNDATVLFARYNF